MLRRSRPSLPRQRGQSNLPTLVRSSRQPQLANPYRFARHEAAQQLRKLCQLSDEIICHSWHSPFNRIIEINVADYIPVPRAQQLRCMGRVAEQRNKPLRNVSARMFAFGGHSNRALECLLLRSEARRVGEEG